MTHLKLETNAILTNILGIITRLGRKLQLLDWQPLSRPQDRPARPHLGMGQAS